MTCCNIPLLTKENVVSSVKTFLWRGGRLIDTAQLYWNTEQYIGLAIRDAGVPREEIWLQSKVNTLNWSPDQGSPKDWVLEQVDKSLQAMGVSFLNVMSLHFGPQQVELQTGKVVSPEEHLEMWKGLIEARRLGKILNLGVCEHSQLEIQNLMQIETPAVALVWLNPWVADGQKAYAAWLRDSGIALVAYGLFNFAMLPGGGSYMPLAGQVAKQHGVTYGQFMIRWAHQQGFAFITGLYHEEYMLEDAVCLNFNVTSQDIAILQSQKSWPCEMTEHCAQQYLPGCTPPEMGPQHHVWSNWDAVSCAWNFAKPGETMLLTKPNGVWNFAKPGEKMLFTKPNGVKTSELVIVTAMLSATAAAIWYIRRRGVEPRDELSMGLMA